MKLLIFTFLTTTAVLANATDQVIEGTATRFNFAKLSDAVGAAESNVWMQAVSMCLESVGPSAIPIRVSKVKTSYDRTTAVVTAQAKFKCVIAGRN